MFIFTDNKKDYGKNGLIYKGLAMGRSKRKNFKRMFIIAASGAPCHILYDVLKPIGRVPESSNVWYTPKRLRKCTI